MLQSDIEKAKKSIALNSNTEGWLTPVSEIIMHCLLSKISDFEEKKDFLEIGCWKGKSGNVLQTHISNNNLYLIDIDYKLDDFLFSPSTHFIKGDINCLNGEEYNFILNNKFSIIHEDTLHNTRTTTSGLELASRLLTDNGIYIIDDFSFSDFTVIRTVLSWLEKNKEFEIFLVDGQKAYLSRREFLPSWYNYCATDLQTDYTSISGTNTTIVNKNNIYENPTIFLYGWKQPEKNEIITKFNTNTLSFFSNIIID